MSFPRYPEYKPSGVEWLGSVPTHWDVLPIKRVATLKSGDSISSDAIEEEADYPVFGGNGLRGYTSAYTHDGIFPLIGRQGALCGNINYGRGKFWASEHAVVASLHADADPTWLGETLRAMNLNQYSVSAAQPGLAVEALATLRIPVPSRKEQAAIASFLDHETAKIDALMAEQEKLIALLKEKRQAVISHAVTKGPDPDARMKHSSVEWLGDVPAHWDIVALSRITLSKCDGPFGSGVKSEHYVDEGARVIRLQNIRGGYFNGSDEAFIDVEYFKSEMARHEVVEGDVLIAGLGDDNNTVGRACVAPAGIEPAMVKADCFRFRLDMELAFSEYVAQALTIGSRFDAGYLSTGTTRSRIPLSEMANRKIPLPPREEQSAIVVFLNGESHKFDVLQGETQCAIELLKERRSALISAAVTGQIDVRGAAA